MSKIEIYNIVSIFICIRSSTDSYQEFHLSHSDCSRMSPHENPIGNGAQLVRNLLKIGLTVII